MPDLFKYLPIIMQLLNLLPKIQTALKSGESITDLLNTLAPELLPILQVLGQAFFPGASDTTQAGALVLSIDVVRGIQQKLNAQGFTDANGNKLTEDGSYGSLTKSAVSKFQAAKGLKVDGWAGPKTMTALSP